MMSVFMKGKGWSYGEVVDVGGCSFGGAVDFDGALGCFADVEAR